MNVQAGQPQFNLEALTGSGAYAGLAQQIQYPPGIYAQIAAAANRAWGTLPNIGAREKLTKVVQGPSKPYSDFVARLMALAGKIFGDVDTAMPVIKQLAFENANKYCQEAIRPHQSKSLNDYLKICRY